MYATNVRKKINRWTRLLITAGVTAVALVVGVAITAVIGNDYRLRQEPVLIPTAQGALEGALTRPASGDTRGLVIVIHGDGPVEATHDGLYLPWFEAAADAGFATLSWSKRGVGTSEGQWLHQSMADRAAEASEVIDWAHAQPDIDTTRIVLWGASQAGWVLPDVAATRDDIDAVVAVGPAINWLRQGRYHLLSGLDDTGATPAERERAIALSDSIRSLIAADADYDRYLAESGDPDPMSEDRWRFAKRNAASDATESLEALAQANVPVLLMLGDRDRNVDVDETARTYQQLLGDAVRVEHFDATHPLARPVMEDAPVIGAITAVIWPRALFAPSVLDTYREYLAGL